MAGVEPQVEWYIARDGAQHGPLADLEMRKFVELGHLRPTDLVWRAGFPDWRPGAQVFPELAPKPVPAPAPVPEPAPVAPAAVRQQPAAPLQPAFEPALSHSMPYQPAPLAEPEPAMQQRAEPAQFGAPQPVQLAASPAIAAGAPLGAPAPRSGPAGVAPAAQPFRPMAGPSPALAEPAPNLSGLRPVAPLQWRLDALRPPTEQSSPGFDEDLADAGRGDVVWTAQFDDHDDDPPSRSRFSFGRMLTMAAGALIIAGSGWVAWQNRASLPGVSSLGTAVMARISSEPSPALYQSTPFPAEGKTREEIDSALQRTALWRILKRDYADWYGERLADVERMRSQNAEDYTVSKFLADVVVVQRRKSASLALAASPERLRGVASAFLANLKQLASRDAQTCFGYISFGEASPYMIQLVRTPAFAETMQRQLIAIFEAIEDGRKSPRAYQSTRRTDYDVLTAELTARGWTQDDLQTFSDPKRLSSSPPDRVCRMVQDWFTVHLSLKDADLQSRLLAETLKPLVQG